MSTKEKDTFRERAKRFVVRPYGYTLHLFVTNDIRRAFSRRNLPTLYEPGETTYAFVWTHEDSTHLYAFLPEGCGLGATAHEMYHVTCFVLRHVGVNDDDEEAWAYTLEELTQMAAEFVHASKHNPSKENK